MSSNFYTHWWKGFGLALDELDDSALGTLMAHCGRGCSASFSKQVYLEQYRAAEDLDDFLEKLNRTFGDMSARRRSVDEIEINYTYCTCPLVRDGHVTNPKLCLCSLKSLVHNWESVLGEGSVACRMEQSILGGGDCCRFHVKLLRQGK
jgi:hypothetical protein